MEENNINKIPETIAKTIQIMVLMKDGTMVTREIYIEPEASVRLSRQRADHLGIIKRNLSSSQKEILSTVEYLIDWEEKLQQSISAQLEFHKLVANVYTRGTQMTKYLCVGGSADARLVTSDSQPTQVSSIIYSPSDNAATEITQNYYPVEFVNYGRRIVVLRCETIKAEDVLPRLIEAYAHE